MVRLEVKGKENLDKKQTSEFEELVKHYLRKLERSIAQIKNIRIKIKKYSEKGRTHQYSINVSVILRKRKFESNAMQWGFNAAIREAFEKILTQMKHVLKNEF